MGHPWWKNADEVMEALCFGSSPSEELYENTIDWNNPNYNYHLELADYGY